MYLVLVTVCRFSLAAASRACSATCDVQASLVAQHSLEALGSAAVAWGLQ